LSSALADAGGGDIIGEACPDIMGLVICNTSRPL